jgi:hypothetical protein
MLPQALPERLRGGIMETSLCEAPYIKLKQTNGQ